VLAGAWHLASFVITVDQCSPDSSANKMNIGGWLLASEMKDAECWSVCRREDGIEKQRQLADRHHILLSRCL